MKLNPDRVGERSLSDRVRALTEECLRWWWEAPASPPEFFRIYRLDDQREREHALERFIDGILREVEHPPRFLEQRQVLEERFSSHGREFALRYLDFEERHLDVLARDGFAESAIGFAKQARAFDPKISVEDIYQASRNVWTMNFLQMLMARPVELTPAIFAYSLLYPYTDNFLDDPSISPDVKIRFGEKFRLRLAGDPIQVENRTEEIVWELVQRIESQFERSRYPEVYDSLLAIHAAQGKSVQLLRGNLSPYEVDVLGISFEKGGTSVLADGYLVAGALTPAEETFMYAYGAFTQLMDDQEDVVIDMRAGLNTVFTQTARYWKLDSLTNRMFQFCERVLDFLDVFEAPDTDPLKEFIRRSIRLLLIDAAGRVPHLYSKNYLAYLQTGLPFRFGSLARQRRKWQHKKDAISRFSGQYLLTLH